MAQSNEPRDAVRPLTEAELAAVVGGIWDNKFQDAENKRLADQNKGQGTLGGSLGDPYVNGQPIF